METRLQRHLHDVAKSLPPTALTIFGATGDLTMRYLLPTLVHMDAAGMLPANFRLVAAARRDFSVQDYIRYFLAHTPDPKKLMPYMKHFAEHLVYVSGNFDDPESFGKLREVLADRELGRGKHLCYNRLYYFATPPEFFGDLTKILKQQGLLMGCSDHKRTVRVLVEKPFGHDLKSARTLNKLLLKYFAETQIYRIDHYLAKETVQNLLVMRFANDFLEPIWNARYIDHIEISVLESVGLEGRAGYYDKAGATRDFLQNHILQMMALVAMDQPQNPGAEAVRNEKVKVLKALALFNDSSLKKNLVRGQYQTGANAPGYAQEIGRKSQTETYIALTAFLNLPRWKGVPFYLRTGKRLPHKVTEVSIHFKQQPRQMFDEHNRRPNVLTFRIQPDERVVLGINNKVPGFGINLHAGSLKFGYSIFGVEIPGAYERLLLDFIEGDQRLFIRSDEIEVAWKFVDSITKRWTNKNAPLYYYRAGSEGPAAAQALVKKDNRSWWTR